VKIFATYLGPKETKYYHITSDHTRIHFPYREPVEVDKETARYLKGLLKPKTDDPMFKLSTDKKEEVDES